MANLFKIAARNLLRYKRRTLLTLGLIVIGVVFVAVFVGVTDSFKNMMIGQITDSYIGHLQIHRKGYLAAIDTLPLNMNLKPRAYGKIESRSEGHARASRPTRRALNSAACSATSPRPPTSV